MADAGFDGQTVQSGALIPPIRRGGNLVDPHRQARAGLVAATRLDGLFGQRWTTETVNPIIKRKFGDAIRSRRRGLQKREPIIKALLQALLDKHPGQTVYVAWDNCNTHEDDEVEAVVRSAAGRLVLLYLPTYSPWLNPIEMLWRHFRREVTHCELFQTVKLLLQASQRFFDRYNRCPTLVRSIIGAHPA
jgi:putative transposase